MKGCYADTNKQRILIKLLGPSFVGKHLRLGSNMLHVIWKIISSLKKGCQKDFKPLIEPPQTKKLNMEFQIVMF